MRVYPKDHSHKRYKIMSHSSLYGTRVTYARTYIMARLLALGRYYSSSYMNWVDIFDQKEGGNETH